MTLIGQVVALGALLVSPFVPSLQTAPAVDPEPTKSVEQRTPAPYPVKQEGAIQPVVEAKSALLIDLPSGTTLYSKDPAKELPISRKDYAAAEQEQRAAR